MATEEGGVASNPDPSSYGGGGAGGKFRRKTFRRQATPYDRPPTALRGHNNNSGGWLKKIFVDPAAKLISYGADRFLASVFRKRLPAPAPTPQQPEANHCTSVASKEEVPVDKESPSKPLLGECSHPNNDFSSEQIFELEQLLKKTTFTRMEIVHLTELLQSKAARALSSDVSKYREDTTSDSGMRRKFSPEKDNRCETIHLSASMLAPAYKSKVPESDFSSPAEIAQAYMEASPSVVRVREDTGLPVNAPFYSKPPTMASIQKNSAVTNDLVTPRSRGRPAIHNIARTPYSRHHSMSKVVANGFTSAHSSPLSLSSVRNGENYESQSMNLKRRSTVLENEIRSVGPMRRTRQKSNLLATPEPYTSPAEGISSHIRQEPESMRAPSDKALKSAMENDNRDVPSTSHAHVPSRSSEVAAKILQQLEKLSPKEKSSVSKSIVGMEKLKPGNTNSVNMSRDSLPISHGSLQKARNINRFDLVESLSPSEFQKSDMNIDSSLNRKSFLLRNGTTDSSIGVLESEPVKNKRAFNMSAEKDFLVMGNIVPGPSSRPEKSEMFNSSVPFIAVPSEETNLKKPEDQLASGPPFSLNASQSFGVSGVREGSSLTFPAFKVSAASNISAPLSIGTMKEANGTIHMLSCHPNVDDNSPSLPSYTTKEAASKHESSSSLRDISHLSASQLKNPEVEEIDCVSNAEAYAQKKSGSVAPAASESHVSVPPLSSSTAASSWPSTGGNLMFSSAITAPNENVNSSTTLGNGVSGLATKSSSSATPLPFAFTVPETTRISGTSDVRSNAIVNPSSGELSASHSVLPAIGARNSGIPAPGFGDSTNSKIFFGDSNKNISSGAGTLLPGSSVNSVSPLPLDTERSTNFSWSSQLFNASSVFGSSASAVDTGVSQSSFVSKADASAGNMKGASAMFGIGASGCTAICGPSSSASISAAIDTGGSIQSLSFASSTSIPGSNGNLIPSNFSFGTVSSGPSAISGTSSYSSSHSIMFGGTSAATSSAINSANTSSVYSNAFGSSLQSPISPAFGAASTSSSASFVSSAPINSSSSIMFGGLSAASATINAPNTSSVQSSAFGSSLQSPFTPASGVGSTSSSASFASSAPINSAASNFNASFGASSPIFSQSLFGKPLGTGFASSPGNDSLINSEDKMAEDTVQSPAPAFPVFGQPSASQSAPVPAFPVFGQPSASQSAPVPAFPVFGQPSASQSAPVPAFGAAGSIFGQPSAPISGDVPSFGSTGPSQVNPFASFGQKDQVASQVSGGLELQAGGSFSFGSGGPDKSRRTVKVSKIRNRKRP